MVHAEYTDEMSGAKDRRPGLDRLLLDARRARIDVVVCWALDRIGRDLKHLLAVLEDLQSLNIPFVSLKEGLDLGSASGRLQLAILAALSQFERERLRERTVAGLERARAQGKRLGRPSEAVPLEKLESVAGISVRRGRETSRGGALDPSALASTGPIKPLRSSLTFRLRILNESRPPPTQGVAATPSTDAVRRLCEQWRKRSRVRGPHSRRRSRPSRTLTRWLAATRSRRSLGTDFTTYSDFYNDFLRDAQAAGKKGTSLDEFVKVYRVADQYKGFNARRQFGED